MDAPAWTGRGVLRRVLALNVLAFRDKGVEDFVVLGPIEASIVFPKHVEIAPLAFAGCMVGYRDQAHDGLVKENRLA